MIDFVYKIKWDINMKFITAETREKAINAVINGQLSATKAAEFFGVHWTTIHRWISTYKNTGSYAGQRSPGRSSKFTQEHKEKLRKLIEEKNDHTLNELVELMGNVAKKINYKPLSYFNGILI